jgi:hypothetical protein
MPKLYELVAVEANLKGQALKCRGELVTTMEKKRHLFQQKLITHIPDGEGEPEVKEQSDIQTTVRKEVEWLGKIATKAIDVSFAIDHANTLAKGDIVLEDGTVVAKDVPTTALLQLEHRVKEVLEFIKAIPTLDPAKGFAPDPAHEAGIYKARDVRKPRTEKREDFNVIVPATKEHPAQVAKTSKDVRIGIIQELEWSALITPADKAELLERGEAMLRGVTQARSRANGQEIDVATHKIGKAMWEHIFHPLLA